MGRRPCCSKVGMNRGTWTAMEDKILTDYIETHGEGNWRNLAKNAGLNRCGKSCRLRWLNYLRPDIKRGNITPDEEELIIRLHKLLGNRWSLIAGRLPGRTDNEIKNYWNTKLAKKLQDYDRCRLSNHELPKKPNVGTERVLHQAPEPNTGSLVIRTKATRCTRVVVSNLEPQSCAQTGDNNPIQDDTLETSKPLSQFISEEKNPSDFKVDFEMDDNFLSDFLEIEFPELSCLNNNGGDCHSQTIDQGHSDDQVLCFSNELLQDFDFPLMVSFQSEFSQPPNISTDLELQLEM